MGLPEDVVIYMFVDIVDEGFLQLLDICVF
jgi:hypothetical protein